ncbi:MAG: mechanosensitive ion channel protein MscS [Flavobacteriaceae bacterium]|nr:MAG: mechanosensitive ion channel protein MscS [Flavobacteriaceae bacterium]
MDKLKEILNLHIEFTDTFGISVKGVLIVIVALILASYILKFSRKIITKKLPQEDKYKFIPLFNYVRWLVFVVIFLIVLNNSGVDLTAILAASTVLLIGVGLALQTLFQDIISGIFIIIDQTVHVGDIIELDGKVGRVDKINLRTTRAVTIDNKVIVIPNHLYLTNSLYNWTENGVNTRENIEVGVAYGSNTQLVKDILIAVANAHPRVLNEPVPMVLFTDFADSALMFKLIFSINNSFEAAIPKSDIRFEIDRKFRENNIQIPFPQRDIHIIQK